jgi:predicted nucleic acid-binding protein
VALGPLHLADKSAWEQARYDKGARRRLHELRETGQLAVCVVSMAELLYPARNAEELARLRLDLSTLAYLHMNAAAEQHLVDVMTALSLRGQHRTPIPDLMLAAIAQAHAAVVLHYDADYERIAAVSGQPQEWVAPRGTGHGSDPASERNGR